MERVGTPRIITCAGDDPSGHIHMGSAARSAHKDSICICSICVNSSDIETSLSAMASMLADTLNVNAFTNLVALEQVLQQITTWLSKLETLQQLLTTVLTRDDASLHVENIANLLRQSRVVQYYLQGLELRVLLARESPTTAVSDRVSVYGAAK